MNSVWNLKRRQYLLCISLAARADNWLRIGMSLRLHGDMKNTGHPLVGSYTNAETKSVYTFSNQNEKKRAWGDSNPRHSG